MHDQPNNNNLNIDAASKSLLFNLSLRSKIVLAFVVLLLMFSISTLVTILKIATAEDIARSYKETQDPIAVKMLSLSQQLNLISVLLNEIKHGKNTDTTSRYLQIETQILHFWQQISDLATAETNQFPYLDITQLQKLFDGFVEHSQTITKFSEDYSVRHTEIKLATEKLQLLAQTYIAALDKMIAPGPSQSEKYQTGRKLSIFQLRYYWMQVLSESRINYANPMIIKNTDTEKLLRYLEQNNKQLLTLQKPPSYVDDTEIQNLQSIHTQYEQIVQDIMQPQSKDWQKSLNVAQDKIRPIVAELRNRLETHVQKHLSESMSSATEMAENLQQVRIYTGALYVLAVIVGLMVALLIQKAIIPPLRNLRQVVDQVASGDLDTDKLTLKNDEIGKLGGSFNRLIASLRDAESSKRGYLDSLQAMNHDLEARVTERTAKLEESETRIRTIHDNVSEGIIVINKANQIESLNRAAHNMFGYSETEAIGLHIADILDTQFDPRDNTEGNAERFLELLASDNVSEIKGLQKNGGIFQMSLLVTHMEIAGKHSNVCMVRDITKRKNAEERLADAQLDIVSAAHKSGMAEMATGVLHNIGNILNSVNISVEEVARVARNSKISGLLKANNMLSDNLVNVAEFLSTDSKGKKLPEYYLKLGDIIGEEFKTITSEVAVLSQKTTMMKEVISTQQSYAVAGFISEEFDISICVDDALLVQKASLEKWGVKVVVALDDVPTIRAQKSRFLQVLTNLVKNAKEAMQDNDEDNREKILTISAGRHNHHSAYIQVKDTGCGVTEDNLASIFQHGFTTKESGHGFGLHSSANAMTEMGGTLSVSSDGLGMGTCFTLTVPIAQSEQTKLSA